MYLSKLFRIAAAILLLTPAASVLNGCGQSCTGTTEVPASWTAAGFSIIEGGKVCAYGDKQISVDHGGFEIPDLYEKYKQQLTAGGWKVNELERKALTFDAFKDNNMLNFQLFECNKSLTSPSTWSKCTKASIKKADRPPTVVNPAANKP